MMKHFLWCLGESQGVTIAFFDCIGRCVGTAPPTLRFAASTCGFHRSGLRWFSPLGATFRFGDCRWAGWFFCLPLRGFPRRVGLRAHCSAFRHAPLRSCRSVGWPSGSRLPLFGTHRFGVALGELELPPSVSEIAARRVGLRTHGFRFSACAASELPLGELAFGLTTSAFRHAPLWGCRSAGWPSGSRLPLFGTHRFGVAAGRVGSAAFRFGDCRWASWPSGSRLPLSACTASGLPSASWFFCLPFRRLPLGGLAFGFTASAFRHAPLRGCCSAGWFCRLPLRRCRSTGWPSGSRLPLFGMRRSAPPHRRREDRRSTPTRHLFHFKTLISTC